MPVPVVRRKPENTAPPQPAAEVQRQMDEETPQEFTFVPPSGNFDAMISSGSTLLDLAISGGRVYGGGIPSGVIIEAFGPESVGKTALLIEMIRSTTLRGGQAWILDPEARMDASYMQIYGVDINKENCQYSRPDTVPQIFDCITGAVPKNKGVVNIVAPDSLAAFTTQMTLDGKDKRGQQRAKEFSQGMTKVARMIPDKNLVLACSNQMRQGEFGDYATGGMAVKYYASLRIKMIPKGVIDKEVKVDLKKDDTDPDPIQGIFKSATGIKTECTIVKNSCDVPQRKANIVITFRYGIDDIRANLQFNKDVTTDTKYECCGNDKSYVALIDAVRYVEDHALEDALRERTRRLWYKIQKRLDVPRKPKVRT